jgi:hypothetical protein
MGAKEVEDDEDEDEDDDDDDDEEDDDGADEVRAFLTMDSNAFSSPPPEE